MSRSRIALPWPPASLSGHANGSRWGHSAVTKKHRAWARAATLAARLPAMPATGDIALRVTFTAPDNRGDRTNYPNRIKPYIDGIAEALGINDRRFRPSYAYAANAKPGAVTFEIEPA